MSPVSLRLFGVDAEAPSRILLGSMFSPTCEVEVFASAEECLKRMQECLPDLLLLDTVLPGMDGFTFCAQLKADSRAARIPVIFISREDSLESRLLGYESGGEDFIFKPYAIDEVKFRVRRVMEAVQGAESIRQQMADGEELSSLLLTNMDEYAVLIQFMRQLNECVTAEAIGETVLTMLRGFRLDGAVQLRLGKEELTLSAQGRDRPLECSVLSHVRKLDRIFQFRQRSVYNFPYITILVNDMPVADPETCGRLRDHLAIAAEMADAKVQALVLQQRTQRAEGGITGLLEELQQIVLVSMTAQETSRQRGAEALRETLDQLSVSFAHLGLSEELEGEIEDMMRLRLEHLISIYDHGDDTMATLQEIGSRLQSILH